MLRFVRACGALAVLAIGAAGLVAERATPAAATTPVSVSVVALGDSYTAGNGALDPYGPADCARSYGSYPWRYVSELRATGVDAAIQQLACSGATTADLTSAGGQIDVAKATVPSADVVLLTIGGNDVGFTSIVASCLLGITFAGPCPDLLDEATTRLPSVVDVDTAADLRAVAAAFGRAQIVLLGYPHLTDPACGTAWDARIDSLQRSADAAQAALVDRLDAEQATTRFHFLDVGPTFAGHGPCAAPAARYVNNLASPLSGSFHPNPAGNQAEADLLYASGVVGVPGDARGSNAAGWYVTPSGTRRAVSTATADCLRGFGAVTLSAVTGFATEATPMSCAADRLGVDGVLHRGGHLVSSSGRFRLEFQASDGNLVLYGPTGARWAHPAPAAEHLVLQPDGNVAEYPFGWVTPAVWSTDTSASGASQLVLQDDGNLVLYTPDARAVWATNTWG